ncbi:AP-1 complex subunit gamma-1-like [Paramacrobiotus metropolitanus]|uniref:AP-1 complex subunit gamma-1-like n=1 Tax=Paramacrobiotus metropolitanus TaxID=2943436 RepID=UPI0024460DC8|nr:AP-1 complex subunit gamma-1-like [Paramacrobiotus metropolitanus]XP_055327271.1 AP-1 complex subunit gamma-1-like [Paramacrobiotus metropolitanus]
MEVIQNLRNQIQDVVQNAIKLPTTPIRLRDLIRQVRAARTGADERSVVNRECADIRNYFREEDSTWRCRNVAKLLYIHMLGYPAHFGQLECLKLIASHRFTDKRIGYLGAMLLLDEQHEVHLLITNCLKNDLNNTNQYVAGLALCALGEICSAEMCRDLSGEIEKLLKSNNSYLRKKAVLCAFRMIQKIPSTMETFIPSMRALLTEKNHGVLLTGVVLMKEMCELNHDALVGFKKLVPNLVRVFKNLIMSGYSPDHDVTGISDPFLQVKILCLLKVLGRSDAETSDMMNDILAQVATNTDGSRNVGNAILYETVLTIMDVKSESGLRVLAVNILGRFLMNPDKNIRYVALNTLLKTVHIDNTAVQRHRSTVLDCLKDPDVSIRRRAMELSFALTNATNVRSMAKELLLFLETADNEFKAPCASSLFITCEKYAPNRTWQIDTMIRASSLSGNYVPDHVVASLIQLIGECTEQQVYAVQELYRQILSPDFDTKQPLMQVACWTIGEFGDVLVAASGQVEEGREPLHVTENDVISALEQILRSKHTWLVTREYAVNALMKLSTRLAGYAGQIQQIVEPMATNVSIEIQQRASEYSQLFDRPQQFRFGILERMPIVKRGSAADMSLMNGEENGLTVPHADDTDDLLGFSGRKTEVRGSGRKQRPKHSDSLLGILDDISILASDPLPDSAVQHTERPVASSQDILDLLDLGNTSAPSPKVAAPAATIGVSALGGLDDLFLGSNGDSSAAGSTFTVYHKNGLRIDFNTQHSMEPHAIDVTVKAYNALSEQMQDFVFQAAVPKALQLIISPPSGNIILPDPSSPLTQKIKLKNPSNKSVPLKMRIRVSYKLSSGVVQDQSEVSSFPNLENL